MSGPEYEAGYRAGRMDARTEWGPDWCVWVPLPYRAVRAGDIVRGDDEARTRWMITRAGWARPIDPPAGADPDARVWSVVAEGGGGRVPFTVDPDMMADVLIEVSLAEAVALFRDEGMLAGLLATRLDPDGGTYGDLDWRGESAPAPR